MALLAVLVFVLLPSADPVRLSRSGVTVRFGNVTTGVIDARVEVAGEVEAVALAATMPHMGHTMPEVVARKEKPGVFLATGELFSMPGRWELAVRAGREVVTFEITV